MVCRGTLSPVVDARGSLPSKSQFSNWKISNEVITCLANMGESGCRRLCKICIVLNRRGQARDLSSASAHHSLSAERFLSKIPYHLCLFIHVINVANRHLKQPNLHLFSSTLKNLYTHQPTHIIKIQIWHGVKLYFPVVFVGTIFNTSENNYYLNFF